ncbi:MAG: hypothetical protein LBE21_04865 [Pseudomonadales bacterium]|nr:hypothetical protein [Pseudomonadales bacterium]
MIAELMTRLEAAGAGYKTIAHAWSLDDGLRNIRDQLPIALFIPGAATSEPSPALPIRQRSTESVIVLTICDWRDRQRLTDSLKGALLGYQHADEYTELEHKAGEVTNIDGQVVHWLDAFTAHRYIEPAP